MNKSEHAKSNPESILLQQLTANAKNKKQK
jgi:hypothetical protein